MFRQKKTGSRLSLPILAELAEEIGRTPTGQLTFLVTEFGRPFTAAGLGTGFAIAGSQSHSEIKAITGHRTDREVTRYTAAADQEKLADQAMEKLRRSSDREQKMAVPKKPVGYRQ